MGSFRQTLRDLPVIGYFLRVVYSVWKLPEMWDVMTGAVPVAPLRRAMRAREERMGEMKESQNTAATPSVMDLTARVIDLTALVREQTINWSQHQERLYGSVPVYLGHDRLLIRTETGQLLICNTQDFELTPQLIDRRVWKPSLSAFYNRSITAGMKYLEIGANIGYFTVLASGLVGPTGRSCAFEAEPTAFGLLEINCRLNHLGEVCEVSPLGVSDVDEHYRNRDIVFDFVRIDAGGADSLLFGGEREFLHRCTRETTIFAVAFDPLNQSGTRLLDHLLQNGFFVWQLSERGELRQLTHSGELDFRCNAELIVSRSIDAAKGSASLSM